MAKTSSDKLWAAVDPLLETVRTATERQLEILHESVGSSFEFTPRADFPHQEVALIGYMRDGRASAQLPYGMRTVSEHGTAFTMRAERGALADLPKISSLAYVELARPMEPELDGSVAAIRARVQVDQRWLTGKDVIVGLIDSGLDLLHPDLRRPTGETRVLAIWDQSLTPAVGESAPAGFGYGVEYRGPAINKALSRSDDATAVRHADTRGHGTHVAGIAAGNGSADSRYRGVAPEADLIIVKNRDLLPDTASTYEAVDYIVQRARRLNRPVVINLSQGNNDGPHDGTSPTERNIAGMLNGPGVALVKSAGNEGRSGHHAHVTVAAGRTTPIRFRSDPGPDNWTYDRLELWYSAPDRMGVSLLDPTGDASPLFPPDDASTGTVQTHTVTFDSSNRVRITHQIRHPFNGDGAVLLEFSADGAASLREGEWTIVVKGDRITHGLVHAWAMRGSKFRFVDATDSHLISLPGNVEEIITVANYDDATGRRVESSGPGPDRTGRLQKPDLSAPGYGIVSAASRNISGGRLYTDMTGTSMSAPHVAGAVALLFEWGLVRGHRPDLDARAVKRMLTAGAVSDGHTGSVPNDRWGAGKIDIQAALG